MQHTVAIDAGSYGTNNRSDVVPAYFESLVMWSYLEALEVELEARGVAVHRCRKNRNHNQFIIQRGKESRGCDLFLDLRTSSDAENEAIPTLYYQRDQSKSCCAESKLVAMFLRDKFAEVMHAPDCRIGYREVNRTRNADRSWVDEWYAALRGAQVVRVPGIVVMFGCHNIKATAHFLLEKENMKSVTSGLADAICDYLNQKDMGWA